MCCYTGKRLTGSVVTLDAAVLVVGCAARYEEAVGELALLLRHPLVVERPAPVRLTAVLLLWGRDRAGCGSGHHDSGLHWDRSKSCVTYAKCQR